MKYKISSIVIAAFLLNQKSKYPNVEVHLKFTEDQPHEAIDYILSRVEVIID